jgi:DNA modification methylase
MRRTDIGAALTRQPVHPFPARMAPGIALRAVSGSRRRLRVLDPMMGSGTVLVAARAKGHYAVGVDIDPLAVLISRVWTTAIDKSVVRILARRVLSRARKECRSLSTRDAYPKMATHETKRFIRYWFDSHARRQLASLARTISRCRDLKSQDVLWCAFSRLIITKQAGVSLALDLAHSRPHKHYERAPIEPFANFVKAVDRVLENCLSISQTDRGPAAKVRLGDARDLKLKDGTIDLVLTSPPYLNAIDYLRCSKFSLVWMGHSTDGLRYIRSKCVGTEVGKYDDSDECASKTLIASLRLKHSLSRRAQAVLSQFIEDMQNAIKEVFRVLAPNGKAIYVIGENTVKGTYVPNAKIMIALAESIGLRLECQSRRTLPPNRRYLPPPARGSRKAALDNRMRREVILHFVKPKTRPARIHRTRM